MSPELKLLIVMVLVLLVLLGYAAYEWIATWLQAKSMRVDEDPVDDERCTLRRFRKNMGQ